MINRTQCKIEMKTEPYIGITDFTSFEQVRRMLDVFRKHRHPESRRILHVGVMMSYKTLNDIESMFSGVFPHYDTVASILRSTDEDVYNCLHYADYGSRTRSTDLVRALQYAGPFVDAIQLDMTWPDPEMVRNAIWTSDKDIEVILQVGRSIFDECRGDPDKIVNRLERYEGVIHRVLLDKSMGHGLGMNSAELIPFVQAIKARFPAFRLVTAGGLGPNSINLVEPLIRVFPDISIDAESKLRPSGSILDPIDWNMASTYLIRALELLR